MITKHDINLLISEFYAKTSLIENCDMRLVANMLEDVREKLDISDPYFAWDLLVLNASKYENDFTLDLLLELKENYFNRFFEKILVHLNEEFKKEKEKGLQLWEYHFAEAAVHLKQDLLNMLCFQRRQWNMDDGLTDTKSKLIFYMREGRWPDAFPFFEEIAQNKNLPNLLRALAEIIQIEIIIYYYPDDAMASSHLENAKLWMPDYFMNLRAEGELLLKRGDIQKAKSCFLQVISLKPGDSFALECMGDCFVAENNLHNAELYYEDAVNLNFLQPETYKKLIILYGNKNWFKEKESLIPGLLQKIEKRLTLRYNDYLISKTLANADCFNNYFLYDTYRAIAENYNLNADYESSEVWYEKAKQLQPGSGAIYLDRGYAKGARKLSTEAIANFNLSMEIDPNDFNSHWALALLYQDLEKKEKALEHFSKCLSLRPAWSDWVNNFIGNLYYSFKEYEVATSYYRKSTDTNPTYAVYKQNLIGAMDAWANQLASESKNEEAIKLYLEAANLENSALRWNLLGNFYYKLERWKEAIGCYDKSIAINNSDPVFYENRGLASEKDAQMDEAEKSYTAALELDKTSGRYYNRLGVFYFNKKGIYLEKSVSFYTEALKKEERNEIYLQNIALAFEELNQYGKALPYYKKILEINPDNKETEYLLGVAYHNMKNYEAAYHQYRKVYDENRTDRNYFLNLSNVSRELGKYEEAQAAIDKAILLDPANSDYLNNKGVIFSYTGNYEKAIEYYKQAVAINPANDLYFENIAACENLNGDFENAIQNYKKAIELNPNNSKTFNALGLAYFNSNQLEEAIKYYKKAIAVEAGNGIYLSNLGLAQAQFGLKEEALNNYKEAVKFSDDYLIWTQLAILYFEKDDIDDAIVCCKKAIELNPQDSGVFYNLIYALVSQGKMKEAKKVLKHPLLTDEVKIKLEATLHQDLPDFYI